MFVVGVSSSSVYTVHLSHEIVTASDSPSSSSSRRAISSGKVLKQSKNKLRQFESLRASNSSEQKKQRNTKGSSSEVSQSKGSSKASPDAEFRSARAVSSSRGKKAQKSISYDRGRKLGFEVLNELLSMQNQSSFQNVDSYPSKRDDLDLDERYSGSTGFMEKVDDDNDGEKTQKTIASDVPSNSFRNAFSKLSSSSSSSSSNLNRKDVSVSSKSSLGNLSRKNNSVPSPSSSSNLNWKNVSVSSSSASGNFNSKKDENKTRRKNTKAAELHLKSSQTAELALNTRDIAQGGRETVEGFVSDTDDGYSSNEQIVSDTEKPSLKGQEILIALQKAAIEKAKLKQQNKKGSSRASKSQVASQELNGWRDAKPIVLKPEWASQIEDLEQRMSELKNLTVSVSSS